MSVYEEDSGLEVVSETDVQDELAKMPMYKVILFNDDYTPMDFVVFVLEKHFHKTHDQAVEIMMSVHELGKGICGIFTLEIAETKKEIVNKTARVNGYPLLCDIEEVDEE